MVLVYAHTNTDTHTHTYIYSIVYIYFDVHINCSFFCDPLESPFFHVVSQKIYMASEGVTYTPYFWTNNLHHPFSAFKALKILRCKCILFIFEEFYRSCLLNWKRKKGWIFKKSLKYGIFHYCKTSNIPWKVCFLYYWIFLLHKREANLVMQSLSWKKIKRKP